MIRLILSIFMLLVLTVFIIMNVTYSTSINLFGYKLENISTIAVVLVSIATGIVYSFFYYILSFLAKNRKVKMKSQDKESKKKAKELKTREKNIQKQIDEGVKNALPPENTEPAANSKKQKSLLDKIKNRK